MVPPCRALWIFLVTLKKSGLPWIRRQSERIPMARLASVSEERISATPPGETLGLEHDALDRLGPDQRLVLLDAQRPEELLHATSSGSAHGLAQRRDSPLGRHDVDHDARARLATDPSLSEPVRCVCMQCRRDDGHARLIRVNRPARYGGDRSEPGTRAVPWPGSGQRDACAAVPCGSRRGRKPELPGLRRRIPGAPTSLDSSAFHLEPLHGHQLVGPARGLAAEGGCVEATGLEF